MSPRIRRSARLASVAAAKPPPRQASLLSSVAERDDTPIEIPSESLNAIMSSPGLPALATPAASSPVKPPMSEMHPSKVHTTMAPPSSAFRLGFTDIQPSANRRNQPSGVTQSTPSKTADVPSSPFAFRFVRPQEDVGLSNEAQQMMQELREEAAKIKADLVAQQEQEGTKAIANGRKIAFPKGKSGRFSAAHIAEFRKMDSIENHASSFRALPGRFTPVTSTATKRSPSKADLDDKDTPAIKPSLKRSPSKANLDDSTSSYSSTTKKQSAAKSSRKARARAVTDDDDPPSPAKRAKQRLEDDASSSRPVSRDASFIPRPKSSGNDAAAIPRSQSTLSLLSSPTKASLARAAVAKTTTPAFKSPLTSEAGQLKKSATTNNIRAVTRTVDVKPAILSPGRLEKVKSILRGSKGTADKANSAIPLPFAGESQTPAPPRLDKKLPSLPATSPRRRLVKRLDFSGTRQSVFMPHSPSPIRSGIPKCRTMRDLGEVQYPLLDGVIEEGKADNVVYPDLSKHGVQPEARSKAANPARPLPPPSVPGTFTFRSDHTIRFNSTSPTGFGSSPGQFSLRHVRQSFMPTKAMPGSFPGQPPLSHPNKENKAPMKSIFSTTNGIAHGIRNKKRHRASSDEDEVEAEAMGRATKKRKFGPVAEGDALLAPRLVGATKPPTEKTPATIRAVGQISSPHKSPTKSPMRSAAKKRPVLSLSRLNMLARPKTRT